MWHYEMQQQLLFPKTGAVIKMQAKLRLEKVQAKLTENGKRLREQVAELGFDSTTDLFSNMEQVMVKAHETWGPQCSSANPLQELSRKIKEGKKEVEYLERLIRNLPDDKTYAISFDVLTYFEF